MLLHRFGTQFRRSTKVCAILISAAMTWAMLVPAHAADIRYVYDENGRLVEVVAPDGSSAQYRYDAVGNINSIKKNTAAALSIAEFTPNSGAAGTAVTLYGSGFSAVTGNNTVKFNGVTAIVSAASAVSLTTVVPPGASTGTISISNSNGSATSAGDFEVRAGLVPTITGFTPIVGSAGTAVTISGTNFQMAKSDNRITFGSVLAPVATATPASLGAMAPSGAVSGKIVVSTPYGKATSSADFYMAPAGINAADIEYLARIAVNGATQTVTINNPGRKALLIFDGLPSQYLSLMSNAGTFAGNAQIIIYQPDGTILKSGNIGNSSVVDFPRLTALGTYSILISPGTSDKGKFDLQVKSESDGTLAIDGAQMAAVLSAGQNGRYMFTGTAGQTLGLGYTGVNTTPAGQLIGFRIYKPDNSILLSTSSTTDNSSNLPKLPTTGSYYIVIDPSGITSANTTLTLSSDWAGTLTADAPATTFNTTRPGQNGRYTFSGSAGQKHWMTFTNGTFPSGARITVSKPEGTTLTSSIVGATAAFDIPALPVTGIYTVFIDPSGSATGKLDLQLKSTLPDMAGSIAIGGAPLQVNLAPHQKAVISFSAQAGQNLGLGYTAVSTTPAGQNMALSVRKPDGNTMPGTNFSAAGSMNLPGLPATGSYTIELKSSGDGAASATLTLSTDLAGTLTAGATAITFNTTRPGQNGRYTFSGIAGRQHRLALTNGTFPLGARIKVLKPDGATLSSGSVGAATAFNIPALPVTGIYTVFIDPYGAESGTVDIQLE